MGFETPSNENWSVEKSEEVIGGMEEHEENVKKLHDLIPDDKDGESQLHTLTPEARAELDDHYKKTNENVDALVSEMPGEDDDEKNRQFDEIRYNLNQIDNEVTGEDPDIIDEEKTA